MDITNIPQNLIKALETKNTEQLAVLSRVLNLVLGKTVIANVASATPVSEPERQELLKQTAAALAQLNQQTNKQMTPAIKAEIARLMQQQNMIQSAELKWLNLVVNNRPLLTYSDRPITAGQNIPVQLQSPQKLVLLDLPEVDPDLPATKIQTSTQMANSLTTIANNTNSTPATGTKDTAALNELLKTGMAELANKIAGTPTEQFKNTPAQPNANQKTAIQTELTPKDLIQKSTTTETAPNKNITEKATLSNSLLQTEANSKPMQQHKLSLYNTNDLSLKNSKPADTTSHSPEAQATKNILSEQLRNLIPHRDAPNVLFSAITQLQQLPATSRAHLFTPSLEQALKSIAEKIRSPEQLAQPKILAQTLKDSGVFFENKLKYLKPDTNAVPANNPGNIYSQDLKGSLLTLLNRVTQELDGKPASTEQTLKLFQHLGSNTFSQSIGNQPGATSKSEFTQTLAAFIHELMHKPVKELSNKELRAQLLTLLQQHSLHSLAKIQLQQLHSLNHELDTKDSAAPNASWQVEIPVKQHNDVHHLHMRIDREWIDEKQESETDKNVQKIKQWSVTLRFDLPTLGEFCAQLTIINTQVSATLWAAREKTFTEVRDHIEGLRKQLESEGINVKYLQCMRGIPPEKPMALSYSLIDIST